MVAGLHRTRTDENVAVLSDWVAALLTMTTKLPSASWSGPAAGRYRESAGERARRYSPPDQAAACRTSPYGARMSAVPVKLSVCLPETSAKPPLPEIAPPRARIVPANVVDAVGPHDHLAAVADRRGRGVDGRRGVDAHLVAVGMAWPRARPAGSQDTALTEPPPMSPPISTVPPPVVPEASNDAALITMVSPVTWILPPLPACSRR